MSEYVKNQDYDAGYRYSVDETISEETKGSMKGRSRDEKKRILFLKGITGGTVDFSRFSRRAFPFSGRTNSEAVTGLNLAD